MEPPNAPIQTNQFTKAKRLLKVSKNKKNKVTRPTDGRYECLDTQTILSITEKWETSNLVRVGASDRSWYHRNK